MHPLIRREMPIQGRVFLEATTTGVLPMPENIGNAVAALDRVLQLRHQHTEVDLAAARWRYTQAVAEAITNQTELPTAESVERVAEQARLHDERGRALDAAELVLLDQLRALMPNPDSMITDHVRPVLTDAYTQAKALLDEHGLVLTGPAEAIITAPKSVGKQWVEFGDLADRAQALRRLHCQITDPMVKKDTAGKFSAWRDDPNSELLFNGQNPNFVNERPWPSDAREHLAWVVQSGIDWWIPTAAERDARHDEVYAEQHRMQPSGGVMTGVVGY